MKFVPIDKMWERIETARQDSDSSLFLNLMYLGETVTKLVALSLVAAIGEDRDKHRYRQLHILVRADSLGDWTKVIDETLTGPSYQFLMPEAKEEQRELTQRSTPGTWQFDSVALINGCLKKVDPSTEEIPQKTEARRWFSAFTALRNKTRGHGATQSDLYARLCPDLEQSIRLLSDNHSLFRREWAYIHRNLSGKYRVTRLTEKADSFDHLKSDRAVNLEDGLYVHLGKPVFVDLLISTTDAVDFFFPNGGFTSKRFELISYITGDKSEHDSAKFLTPASELPDSETQGIGRLDVQGNCFANLPPVQAGYIHRDGLENELLAILGDDRHPVVTLVGRGGIGKTTLALSVLHEKTAEEQFVAILWFSARDIDLLPEGPKLVRPHVLTEKDIAREFVRLMSPTEEGQKGFDAIAYLSRQLTKSELGGPLLFVFDNFETVRNPLELFKWIDTYVRLPNKVLLTTRFREFKGDYPVEVPGMAEVEFEALVDRVSEKLGVQSYLTEEIRKELYRESDGHPYVAKLLLGEIAKAGKSAKVERVIARSDEVLDALFERTFSRLSPAARRVFLTLCNWRSLVPQLAMEAVLLRPANEKMDAMEAIEELRQSSFIEVLSSNEDNQVFLAVPLVASVFGNKKLAVSPMKAAVEADTVVLRDFGASQQSDLRHGIAPHIERIFKNVAFRVSQGREKLEEFTPMLEFVASNYSSAWLSLSKLYEESNIDGNLERAKHSVRRYLESKPRDKEAGWRRIADLCQRTNDYSGEVHALVEMSQLPGVPFDVVSNAANRLNLTFSRNFNVLDNIERPILIRKLVDIMEKRIDEADADGCSRLAWLCLRLHDESKAKKYTDAGLRIDAQNDHCQNLATRLGISTSPNDQSIF